LRVKVRVKLLGIPVGVRTSGGILDQVLREVEIECLPADIPSSIAADVSELALFASLRVSDLPHSDKIKYLNAEDATVAHVVSIREEAPTPAEVEAAATAAATAATAAAAEPEVAKKGKPEDAAKKPEAGAKKADAGGKKPEAKK
jgi:large subunit ribosomal protein L25